MPVAYRKDPTEVIRIPLYFGYDMPQGDTIASVTAQVSPEGTSGLSCTLSHTQTDVSLVASSGAPDSIYQVYVKAVTTGGLTLLQQVEVVTTKGVS